MLNINNTCTLQLDEIENVLAQEGAQSQLQAAKKELLVLARECRRAFEAVGMEQSSHPQVRKAFNLCLSYVGIHRLKKPSTYVRPMWLSLRQQEHLWLHLLFWSYGSRI